MKFLNSADENLLVCGFIRMTDKMGLGKYSDIWIYIYTETIKLCPLDVYVCQFQMYERISFKISNYSL